MKFGRFLKVRSGNVAGGSEKWPRAERRFDVRDKGFLRTPETETSKTKYTK